jgi:hypothetical protein
MISNAIDAAFRREDAARERWGIWWVPPARQFYDALEKIEPKPECVVRCENEIVRALMHVDVGRFIDHDRIPNETLRKMGSKAVKALLTIETFWNRTHLSFGPFNQEHMDSSFGEQVRKYRGIVERGIESIGRYNGSKPRSYARQHAADSAHRLLYNFGDHHPTLTREGHWQELATILYGDQNADLYDYLQTSSRPTDLLFDMGAYTAIKEEE